MVKGISGEALPLFLCTKVLEKNDVYSCHRYQVITRRQKHENKQNQQKHLLLWSLHFKQGD